MDLRTVIEAKNQHPQSSWEPALISVTSEILIVDIYFMVNIEHLKAHDYPMVDASMPFICSSKSPVQHHH